MGAGRRRWCGVGAGGSGGLRRGLCGPLRCRPVCGRRSQRRGSGWGSFDGVEGVERGAGWERIGR